MRLIIISGSSGSGKSTALNILEDIGYTCIDNLPASLIPSLVERIKLFDDKNYAVSIDARNTETELELVPYLIQAPDFAALEHQLVFLDAEDDTLLQRFSETRRRHPLSDKQTNLSSAIVKEKQLLSSIIDLATITIDTTEMGFHDLRDFIKRNLSTLETPNASLLFQSFGFKYGLPRNTDFIFDVRCLPNPHWEKALKPLTGNDQPVKDFLAQHSEVNEMYNDIRDYLNKWLPRFEANNRSYLTVAIGCTGGQHRSVYLCNLLTEYFSAKLSDVQSQHRELRV